MKEKSVLDTVIEKYKIQPVGNGYIDLICPWQSVNDFIDELTQHNIKITGFTWWCHAVGEHNPCGMGGPKNKFGDGFFSEIEMGRICEFSSNKDVKSFLLYEWVNSDDYKPCYVPAFWLDVPKDWKIKGELT